MNGRHLYLNGVLTDSARAAISPFDIGFLRGYAVFDLLRTIGGEPFLLAEHLRRLRASAALLGLTVPMSDREISEAIADLLSCNEHAEAAVRLVLSGGESSDGMAFNPSTPTFVIMTHELHEPPASLYTEGGVLVTRRHRREVPQAKTTNYVTMLRHKSEAADAGAMDLLYHDGEKVFEAASASVYFIKDGVIMAPDSDVLWGTIGSYVLDLARPDYEVAETTVSLAAAFDADEVFLTSTTRGVVPIVRIDESPIGSGRPGPIVADLMRRFREGAFGEGL